MDFFQCLAEMMNFKMSFILYSVEQKDVLSLPLSIAENCRLLAIAVIELLSLYSTLYNSGANMSYSSYLMRFNNVGGNKKRLPRWSSVKNEAFIHTSLLLYITFLHNIHQSSCTLHNYTFAFIIQFSFFSHKV